MDQRLIDRDQFILGKHKPAADRPQPHRGAEAEQALGFVVEAARLMHDRHCTDIVVFDLRGLSDVTDFVIVASGTSERQIDSVASEIEDMADEANFGRMGREQDSPSKWIVLDLVDVVVHLFDPETRSYYDLEMLWGDAPRIAWQRP